MRYAALLLFAAATALPGLADSLLSDAHVTGSYVEVRSCDVYTGPCFANSEMGLTGKQAILTWAVDKGSWDGTNLDGLTVIAVVKAAGTLDNIQRDARPTKSVVIVDARADEAQRTALVDMAKALGNGLVADVAKVKAAPIETTVGHCSKGGCAEVKADGLVHVITRCMGGQDHVCGNEETFYPPLTAVDDATPAYTTLAEYRGDGLGLTWRDAGSRSAFLAGFAR